VEPIGAGAALAIPLGLFAAAAIGLVALRGDFAPAPGVGQRRFLADASEGYRYLYRRTELLELTFSALAINFLSALAFVELGLYVQFWLALSNPIFVGLMISGGSLGAAVGTLAVNRLSFERRAGRLLWILPVFQGLTIVVLGLVRSPWLAIPDMFLFGVFPGMFATVFFATVQATVPDDRLGRVLAADEVGSYALIPVGQAAGGLLTVTSGIQVTYLTAGIGTVGVGLLMGAMPELRRLGFEPEPETPAGPPSASPVSS
jgi:MFS family permease